MTHAEIEKKKSHRRPCLSCLESTDKFPFSQELPPFTAAPAGRAPLFICVFDLSTLNFRNVNAQMWGVIKVLVDVQEMHLSPSDIAVLAKFFYRSAEPSL